MACNCGKKRKTRPFGPSSTDGKSGTTSDTSSGKGRSDSFVLRTSTGTQTFGSELEAQAAKRRAGGGSIVRRRG